MAGPTYGEIKVVSALAPSGSPTSSGVWLGGFRKVALLVPVINSGLVEFIAPYTGVTNLLFRDKAGGAYSAATPGGTGGMWLGSEFFTFLEGFGGPVSVSGGAQQTADTIYVWHLKG